MTRRKSNNIVMHKNAPYFLGIKPHGVSEIYHISTCLVGYNKTF